MIKESAFYWLPNSDQQRAQTTLENHSQLLLPSHRTNTRQTTNGGLGWSCDPPKIGVGGIRSSPRKDLPQERLAGAVVTRCSETRIPQKNQSEVPLALPFATRATLCFWLYFKIRLFCFIYSTGRTVTFSPSWWRGSAAHVDRRKHSILSHSEQLQAACSSYTLNPARPLFRPHSCPTKQGAGQGSKGTVPQALGFPPEDRTGLMPPVSGIRLEQYLATGQHQKSERHPSAERQENRFF